MNEVILDFKPLNGTTWFYLSMLLAIAVYFQFSRFFSLRNLDYLLLYALSPALIAVDLGERKLIQQGNLITEELQLTQQLTESINSGYIWLFVITTLLCIRCVFDLIVIRKPRLDPNLNVAGMCVLCVALFGFLTYELMKIDVRPNSNFNQQILATNSDSSDTKSNDELAKESAPPTKLVIHGVRSLVNKMSDQMDESKNEQAIEKKTQVINSTIVKSCSIICHLSILLSLFLIGRVLFANTTTGVAMIVLYLLLPITAVQFEKIDQLLPTVFLLWAIYFYSDPRISAIFFAFAALFIHPLLLLPLWCGFYFGNHGSKGLIKFLSIFVGVSAAMWFTIWWMEPFQNFLELWTTSYTWKQWYVLEKPGQFSFWSADTNSFRIPLMLALIILSVLASFWPKDKKLSDLLAISSFLMLMSQFVIGDHGGYNTHWYIPILLITVFRPNLDRTLEVDKAKSGNNLSSPVS